MDHSTVCYLNKNVAIYECSFENEYFNDLSSTFHGKMTYPFVNMQILFPRVCYLFFCLKIFHFVYSKCQWLFYRISHEFLVVFFLIYCSMSSKFTSFKMVKFTSFKNHKVYSMCK